LFSKLRSNRILLQAQKCEICKTAKQWNLSIHRRKPVVKGREKQQPQSGLTKGKKQMISRISSTPSGLSNLSLALPHALRVDNQISLRWSEQKI